LGSAIITLSEDSAYVGGGTWFENLSETIKPKQGELILFPGKFRHKGKKISSGTRYLLVAFFKEGK
tara:strand:+ start:348 stop:545 length:198 start_codon:yes stop_codon:yes gene_type:complete